MTLIVALTGGIGSGKSTVATIFAKYNVPIIDADVIAREIVEKNILVLKAITQHFGAAILNKDSTLNRNALRRIIFDDYNEKKWLEKLLHPLIAQETKKKLSQAKATYVIWVVPLLIEKKLYRQANRVLVVDTNLQNQLKRTMSRDNITQQQVEKIIASQVSQQERLKYADDIIDNNGGSKTIETQVEQLHQQYLKLASSMRM